METPTCDTCNKEGSFGSGDKPTLYAQDFDEKAYCDDCIPKWWVVMIMEDEKEI
tara:strand:+ start:1066 stop:1227 length:162 start_codon:yes stop_codon:yes gene_type:complete